jgi:hypothetical protein
VNDGIAIEEVHGGHDAIPELLFGRDADMAQHGAGQFGGEALDEVEPRAVLGSEGELEVARGLLGEPGFGLLGDMSRMIIRDEVDLAYGAPRWGECRRAAAASLNATLGASRSQHTSRARRSGSNQLF